ncbi:WD40 repeat protein [Streptosporangium becharense]|uniref:WD40 repeat protein n=1 Tax=Streptosporangium becharense TaxID=1816182 RepID=A0A7W9IJ58_9ACTN|nr:DNA-directed RNA polymerase subunit alpha C-terminal domain-containing protein [Streptosporangium becharense]MBB2913949.1 WD40 repeat protein [Streptosporangium becharense]MBB5821390.1 WD40 repeat protein [Streptosporangium becharense]
MSLRHSWTTDDEPLCLPPPGPGDWDPALPIEELNLTVRSYNLLKRAGIDTCGELTARSERDLLAIEGIDSGRVEDIKRKLAEPDVCMSLRDAPPDGVREHVAFIEHGSSPSARVTTSPADGHPSATAGWDDSARLWDTVTGRPVGVFLPGRALSVAFHPEGRLLAAAGDDRTVRLWDTATGLPVGAPLTGHTDTVWSVAFHPEGRLLATASSDDSAQLWDTATGLPAGRPLAGHIRSVYTTVFHPEGHLLATAGWDYGIRLWEVATSRLIALFTGHTGAVWSAAFHPDGHLLATADGDWDYGIRLWDVPAPRS